MQIQIGSSGHHWWDLVPAIVGGVIGALAGGIPAYLLSIRASREVLARDKLQRERDDQSKAFRLFARLSAIANSLLTVRQMIESMLQRTVDPNDLAPTQRKVSAIVGISSERNLSFDADDLALFVATKNIDLVTDLPLLAARHTAICAALEKYESLKLAHADLMSAAGNIEILGDGRVGTTIKDPLLAVKIKIADQQLESVIVEVIDMLIENTGFTFDLTDRFNAVMKSLFPSKLAPTLDMTEAKSLFISPKDQSADK